MTRNNWYNALSVPGPCPLQLCTTIPETLAMAIEHYQAGRLQVAEEIYREILAVDAGSTGCAPSSRRDCAPDGQAQGCRRVHRTGNPAERECALFHNNLGEVYPALRKFPEAVASYRRALKLRPDYAAAHNNLGHALRDQGKLRRRSPATAGHWN